jgi:hypothetical protein
VQRPRESIDDLDALLGALPPEIVEAVTACRIDPP